eukprot:12335992-Prorocentrum_lima.AAC.1
MTSSLVGSEMCIRDSTSATDKPMETYTFLGDGAVKDAITLHDAHNSRFITTTKAVHETVA